VDAARRGLAELAQYLALTAERSAAPCADVPDVRPQLTLARHDGATLDPQDLLGILTTLRTATALRRFLGRAESDATELAALAARLQFPAEIEQALIKALDDTGRVHDDATPELARIRTSLRTLRTTLESRLTELLTEADRDIVSEHYVTLRNNRFVVPIRTSAAQRIPGVIQDRSASGETVFLEPLFAVELNNRVVLARKEEDAEERRICARLTAEIGQSSEALAALFEAVLDADVLAARAALAGALQASIPVIGADRLHLVQCRHPLLALGDRPVTAIDLTLAAGCRGLVITGPNTGGKTVALKTAGLVATMAQCGLAIPAREGSVLPWFTSIYADIGDGQSIERNLSTFSSHMENLAEIMRCADDSSLIILDEPGVGTDPTEGAALAVGLLGHVCERNGWLVASSHAAEVKTFALAESSLDVAAVTLDPTTGQPCYRLEYHVLGQSLALPMARRLGVPEPVLRRAQRQLAGADGSEVARATARLEAARQAYETNVATLDAERESLERTRCEHEALVADLREQQQSGWQRALAEAHTFLQEFRAEGQRSLDELRRNRAGAATFRRAVRDRETTLIGAEAAHSTQREGRPGTLTVGTQVEVVGQGIRGELVELRGERARIRRGALRFEVPAGALRPIDDGGGAPRNTHATEVRLAEIPEVASELTLLGVRAREAIRQLEEFLDHAMQAGVPSVRIIHGLGGGALRRAVHDYLGTSPYCGTFREAPASQGGAGVTVVDLARS
jgi:DNA mismatch repair protein MutS2